MRLQRLVDGGLTETQAKALIARRKSRMKMDVKLHVSLRTGCWLLPDDNKYKRK